MMLLTILVPDAFSTLFLTDKKFRLKFESNLINLKTIIMKKSTLSPFRLTLLVALSTLLLSSCTMDKLVSKDDFYVKRIVKKNDSRTFTLNNRKIKYADISRTAGVFKVENDQLNNYVSVVNQAIELQKSIIPTQIATSVSRTPNLTPREGVGVQIKNVFLTSKNIKSFKREYNSIKQEQIKHFIKKNKTDDPLPEVGKPAQGGKGLSIASFVLSLVGLLIFGLICGILAIVFGAIALGKGNAGRGLAIAGIVIGVIDVVFVLVYLASLA